MEQQFSVLMSIYIKVKPAYARACFESLLRQSVQAAEWVIVEDGPLTRELYDLLTEYETRYPDLIRRVPLANNVGLGRALREGVTHCSYELIARMDTDDICREDRFEKQLQLFAERPELDICSSHIQEFHENPGEIASIRKVPLEEKAILEYQKRRDSFNHVAVMFKKSAVLQAGNYQHAPLMEDSLLWINMMRNGARCGNVDDFLVYVRTGRDMFARRGGWGYFKKYLSGRREIYKTGYISLWDYWYTLLVQLVVALLPNGIRRFVFEKLLRN